MKTDQHLPTAALVFLQSISAAVTQLKEKLRRDYEEVYPDLGEIIQLVLEEEETKAWEFSPFPHLFFPDLVEAHVARLGLKTAKTKHDDVLVPRRFFEMPTYQPVLALCGS